MRTLILCIFCLCAGAAVTLALNGSRPLFRQPITLYERPTTADQVISRMDAGPERDLVQYGKELFFDTAKYIGPKGTVARLTRNYYSCKNCHLEGGMRELGLSLMDSHGLYPQYRAREGKVLDLANRVNTCIRNPMNGEPLKEDSREMQAMILYLKAIGQGRAILPKDKDDRLPPIEFPAHAASPDRGKALYQTHCASCHGANGAGQGGPEGYVYPPLWGEMGYRVGSSMQRVSVLARFIKFNMPFGIASPTNQVVTDAEAFDIAAYVNSEHINPRPLVPAGVQLFPNPNLKPFDTPIGPYADPFPPDQHRYGPFPPIIKFQKENRDYKAHAPGDLIGP